MTSIFHLSLWTGFVQAPEGPGAALIGGAGQPLDPGQEVPREAIGFSLTQEVPEGVLDAQAVEVTFPVLLRLDEVSFPPCAVAYRHTHPGPGFRFLRRGHLTLEGEHSFAREPGEWWFEPANTPVHATAGEAPETRFVRCMVLPPEYFGRSTFTLCDPSDAARERHQSTHRHVDLILETWPQGEAG